MPRTAPCGAEPTVTPLDRDFAQFARTAEPAALGRVYDQAAAELLQLATRLVGDPVEAEDLVQATFVAAIESAHSFADGKRAMPWLVGILSNRARRFHQVRQRTAHASSHSAVAAATAEAQAGLDGHEAPSTPGSPHDGMAATTPSAQLEKKELDAAVAEALHGLSAVLHPVVVLHLRHGMQPAEIAYALQRPPATVRSQLARGLADLRRRLPRKQLLPALLVLPVPRGLEAVRAAVLEHGATYAATLAAATVSATSVAGVMIMTKQMKLVAAAVVVLALGAGAWWLPRGGPLPRNDAAAGPASPASAASNRSDVPKESTARATAAANEPAERVRVAAGSASALRVTVRTATRPVAGAIVELLPTHVRGDIGRPLRMATDAATGAVHFADVPWRHGHVHVKNAKAMKQWRAEPGTTTEIELVVREPSWVNGRVLGPNGLPAGDATVWLVEYPYAANRAHDVLRTESDGSFTLPIWNWHLIGARAPGTVAVHREVKAKTGANVDVVLQLRANGAALRGRVVRGDPAVAVAFAEIEVGDRLGPFEGRLLPDGSRESVVAQTTVAGPDGTFALDGLLPGPVSVFATARGHATVRQTVDLLASSAAEVKLTLADGVRVHGRVTYADGTPARQTMVECGQGLFLQRARVDRDGGFELQHVPTGMQRLIAHRAGGTPARLCQLVRAGEDIEWNPVLDARWSRIGGTVRDEHGQPLADWWVVLHTTSKYGAGIPVRTTDDGSFLSKRLLAKHEAYELRVHPPCKSSGGTRPSASLPAVMTVPSVPLGAQDVEVVVAETSMPTAWVTGRIAGGGAGGTELWLVSEFGSSRYLKCARDGSFSCGPLAPGHWRIMRRAFPIDSKVSSFVLHAREARELGTLTVGDAQHGDVDILLSSGKPNPNFAPEFRGLAAVQVLRADNRRPDKLHFVRWAELTGERTSLRLVPGKYVLRVCGAPLWAPPQTCEVVDGKSIEVMFRALPAAMQRIAFRHPQTEHPFEQLALTVHNGQGALLWSQLLPPRQKWWHTELNLLPGTYRVAAKTVSGLHCERQLIVADTSVSGRPLVLDLLP